MPKKDNSLAAFMLVQQLDDDYWFWAKEPEKPDEMHWDINDAGHIYQTRYAIYVKLREALQAARGGDVAPLVLWVADRLMSCGLFEVHGILHGNDKIKIWVAEKGAYDETQKTLHVHILVRFTPAKDYMNARTLTAVSAALGVAPQYIERPGKGRYAVDNMLSYLTHIKYEDKYQYSPEDVFSYVPDGSQGETYAEIYARRRMEWVQGRGAISKKKASISVDSLIEDIKNGKITKQQILLTDDLFLVYCYNRRKINEAFACGLERKVEEVKNDMKAGKFRLSIFFITGEAGHGKSLFADFFSTAIQKYQSKKIGENWQTYDAAATNGLDDYGGEEILILDDLRAGAMRSEDWLRLLDNNRTKAASARFYNKTPICKVLIITSIKEPFEFFDACARTESEDLNQFIRRISARVQVVNYDEYFAEARLKIGEVKRVKPFEFGLNEKPLVYNFEDDNREYSPLQAVKRLLGIVEKSSIPALSPYPEGWETAIFEPLEEDTPDQQTLF